MPKTKGEGFKLHTLKPDKDNKFVSEESRCGESGVPAVKSTIAHLLTRFGVDFDL